VGIQPLATPRDVTKMAMQDVNGRSMAFSHRYCEENEREQERERDQEREKCCFFLEPQQSKQNVGIQPLATPQRSAMQGAVPLGDSPKWPLRFCIDTVKSKRG